MTDALASVAGHRIVSLRVLVANTGPWIAECDLEGAADVSGRVTVVVGNLSLSGTVTRASGVFGEQRKVRVVAGAAGWAGALGAKGYHNDAGVKAALVATDAARECGETLGSFVPTSERLGRDYLRQAGPASRTLEDALGGAGAVAWWVDYAGLTQVGARPATALAPDAVHVLAYDPRARLATLAVDDLAAVRVGSILTENLDAPQTIREFEIRLDADELRVLAWCGGTEQAPGHLAALLRGIITRATDGRLHGVYRYRVGEVQGDRLALQPVRRAAGLPDAIPVSMWPGLAGCFAVLAPGAEVLLQFVEGDRTQPVVTAFAGKDGVGFVPVSLTLGGPAGLPVARLTDPVQVTLPPAAFSGTIGGSPATGTVTWAPPATANGTIVGGSSKVSAA